MREALVFVRPLSSPRARSAGAVALPVRRRAYGRQRVAERLAGERILTAGTCTACGRCVAACPEDTLAVSPGLDLARLEQGNVDLAEAAVERCRRCATQLPPRPMRVRLRELVPEYADPPLDLCAGCAAQTVGRQSNTIA